MFTEPLTEPLAETMDEEARTPSAGRWRLWIDRCGGFDIWLGDQLSIGGSGGSTPADFAIRCGWPNPVAVLIRSASGDWLLPAEEVAETNDSHGAETDRGPQPLLADQILEFPWLPPALRTAAFPKIRYRRPSPLSRSAVLMVLPPHRTLAPTDGMVLMDQTLLLGPEPFNHVCTPGLSSQQWVLFRRADQWWIRGQSLAPRPLLIGQRWQSDDWALSIRPA